MHFHSPVCQIMHFHKEKNICLSSISAFERWQAMHVFQNLPLVSNHYFSDKANTKLLDRKIKMVLMLDLILGYLHAKKTIYQTISTGPVWFKGR